MSTQMPTATPNALSALYHCSQLSCIDVYGADAVTFLQSQLTQDLTLLSHNRAAVAGYCSAQGRLLASFVLCPTDQADRVRLIVRHDLAEGLVKRLRMFVLRSKVTLEPQPQLNVYGLIAPSDEKLAVDLPHETWATSIHAEYLWVRAPSAKPITQRAWIVCEPSQLNNLPVPLQQPDSVTWDVEDILSGLAWIQDSTRDLFIPQTINLDLIDGVSFTKGCYPGQEVVARAHYRSKVKRRMHAAKIIPSQPHVQAGFDVHPAGSPDDPCGRIIQAIHAADSSYVLFEAPDQQILAGPLGIAQVTDSTLQILALPYSTQAAQ